MVETTQELRQGALEAVEDLVTRAIASEVGLRAVAWYLDLPPDGKEIGDLMECILDALDDLKRKAAQAGEARAADHQDS